MKEPSILTTAPEAVPEIISILSADTAAPADWPRLAIENARQATEAIASGQYHEAAHFIRFASRMTLLLSRRETAAQTVIRPREYRVRRNAA